MTRTSVAVVVTALALVHLPLSERSYDEPELAAHANETETSDPVTGDEVFEAEMVGLADDLDDDAGDHLGDDPRAADPPPVIVWHGRARITSFAPGCGDSGRTATGTRPSYGTVATDPRVIPTYSHLEIEGLQGTFQALDTGGGVKGAHIDLWLPSCSQARQWGSQMRAYRVLR